MSHHRRAGIAPTGNDVHHTRRQTCVTNQLRKFQRGDGCALRRFQHNGVSQRKSRSEFPRQHQQREIPRNHLANDAKRFQITTRCRILQLIRPAGVVEEMRGRHRHIEVARLADRLTAIKRFRHCKLPRSILQQPCQTIEILPALRPLQFRPRRKSFRRCRVGRIDIRSVRHRDFRNLLLIPRADRIEPLLRFRSHKLAVDENPVAIRNASRGRFRGRIKFPQVPKQKFARHRFLFRRHIGKFVCRRKHSSPAMPLARRNPPLRSGYRRCLARVPVRGGLETCPLPESRRESE